MSFAMRRVPSDRSRQSGLAAVEFSFVITIFIAILVGVVGFGALFWTQQRLAETASEGARAAIHARAEGTAILATELEASACLPARTLFDDGLTCHVKDTTCPWPSSKTISYTCVSVVLTYDTTSWAPVAGLQALVSLIPLPPGKTSWIPGQLHANADVQIWQSAL